jgi:hypothetical protein
MATMTIATAERMAEVLGGRVWTGGEHVRVYVGRGKSESCISVAADGAFHVAVGRGVHEAEVTRALVAAGLATGRLVETAYGTSYYDDVRVVEVQS